MTTKGALQRGWGKVGKTEDCTKEVPYEVAGDGQVVRLYRQEVMPGMIVVL